MTTAADAIRQLAPGHETPRLALVLGSGLGPVADAVEDPVVIAYDQLPGFPVGSVAGHAGRLVLGRLGGTPVAVFQGRAHLYEGIPATQLAVPTRTARALGAEQIVVTNAAGSLRAEIGPGRLMAITDHINFTGANPLIGPNDDALGPRFVPMGTAYDRELTDRLHRAAEGEGIHMADGVYLAVAGPSFETPAEIRAFRTLGADLVGMSTVPEVIAARHAGLRCAAISAVTNLAEGMGGEELSHEQTLRVAKEGAARLGPLIERFVEDLG